MTTQVELLKKYGVSVRGHVGQHLLIDPNIQRKIIDCLQPLPGERILEIGPGLGALTGEMLRRGWEVWAVEKDKQFIEILRKELESEYPDRLHLIHRDILTIKLEQIQPGKGKVKWYVVSNLPYYITAPILFHLLEARRYFRQAVLMMQREVARRLWALPGSKDYGRLTLGVRYHADVENLFDIPPGCFTPKPEVHSSLIRLTLHTRPDRPKYLNEQFLFYLIQIAFAQRRKTLLHILLHDQQIKQRVNRAQISKLLESLGLSVSVRGENLLLKDFMALALKLQSR